MHRGASDRPKPHTVFSGPEEENILKRAHELKTNASKTMFSKAKQNKTPQGKSQGGFIKLETKELLIMT